METRLSKSEQEMVKYFFRTTWVEKETLAKFFRVSEMEIQKTIQSKLTN